MASPVTPRPVLAATARSAALADIAVVAVALAVTLALVRHGGASPARVGSRELDLVGVLLIAGGTLPLPAWRRHPLGVFVGSATAGVLLAGLGYPVDLLLGPIIALYLLAAGRDPEASRNGRTTVAIVVGLFVAYLGATAAAHGAFPGIELLHTGLAWAVAWFAGERTRLRREHVADLHARVARAEREAERERQLAIAEERARIARDLHDSAGHAISVIAVRAGAARLRHEQDPDRSLLALRAVEDLARRTAEEIDHIVGALRADGQAGRDVDAPVGLASLDTLVAHHLAGGLTVIVETAGTPRPLGAAADQAAYRILQEALTNAARHGSGQTQVSLAFVDVGLDLTVTNPVRGDGPPRPGGGRGLIGMRERAALLGGRLDTDRVDDTFRVRARIPYGSVRR